MSNTFFTSDTHWKHTNIMRYSNRPFNTVEEMNEALIENWNKTVGPRDTVYHLGDFCFGNKSDVEEILKRLNGHVYWCYGNHDSKKGGKAAIRAEGFTWKGNYKEAKMDGIRIMMAHYAHLVWNKSHHGTWFLCGHSHGELRFTLPDNVELAELRLPVLQLDVGVDVAYKHLGEYRPFSYEEVKEVMVNKMSKIEKFGDHHGKSDKVVIRKET
jgi:calcineurin-like phosphoesterase family protein